MTRWDRFVKRLMDLLDKVLGLLAVFSLGHKLGRGSASKTEAKLAEVELKLSYEQNKDDVSKKLSGLSDSDVIDAAIKSERKDSE